MREKIRQTYNKNFPHLSNKRFHFLNLLSQNFDPLLPLRSLLLLDLRRPSDDQPDIDCDEDSLIDFNAAGVAHELLPADIGEDFLVEACEQVRGGDTEEYVPEYC